MIGIASCDGCENDPRDSMTLTSYVLQILYQFDMIWETRRPYFGNQAAVFVERISRLELRFGDCFHKTTQVCKVK
jgi:hypothetical protein